MSQGLEALLLAAIGQEAPPAARAAEGLTTTEYVIFAVIGVVLLAVVIKLLRTTPPAPPIPAQGDAPLEAPALSDAEIRQQARQAFSVNQVETVPGTDQVDVYRMDPDKAAAPTRDASLDRAPAKPKAQPAAPTAKPKAAAASAGPKADASAEAAGRTLREGLSRTHNGFVSKLSKLFGAAKAINDDLLADLEEALFTADIGVRTSQKLVELVQSELDKRALKDPGKVWEALKGHIADLLGAGNEPLRIEAHKPFVIMVVGVNGAGKTTTIGKLARRYSDAGHKVMLAAGDTFRAAAVEQLQVWAERAGVPVVRGAEGQDPSSVVFEAIDRATREGYDICICDTAGRLQAKKELMDELAKVHRVSGKALDGAPHEVWLVLDATNGQNAISQAKIFTEVVEVTGIVLTKLDGTAKGGVVIGIADEMQIPVRFIGIGEKVEDLRPFEPAAFADALFADA